MSILPKPGASYPVSRVEVRCIADCRDKIGEGAFWCPDERAVYWLDVPMPSRLHRLTPASGHHEIWPMPEMITALAKRADGSLLIASERGISFFDPKEGKLERQIAPEADLPRNRSNDGAPDARGRFWMGTMMNNLGPDGEDLPITEASGALWCIHPDLSYRRELADITITNGVVWSPDGTTLYVADSALKVIHAYDFDMDVGHASNRRVFSAITDLGSPDGAAIDRDGCLWSARWEGDCVARFSPDGTVRPHRSHSRLPGHLLRIRRGGSEDALCNDRAPRADRGSACPPSAGGWSFRLRSSRPRPRPPPLRRLKYPLTCPLPGGERVR